jgi:hypothetical protein
MLATGMTYHVRKAKHLGHAFGLIEPGNIAHLTAFPAVAGLYVWKHYVNVRCQRGSVGVPCTGYGHHGKMREHGRSAYVVQMVRERQSLERVCRHHPCGTRRKFGPWRLPGKFVVANMDGPTHTGLALFCTTLFRMMIRYEVWLVPRKGHACSLNTFLDMSRSKRRCEGAQWPPGCGKHDMTSDCDCGGPTSALTPEHQLGECLSRDSWRAL